MWECERVGGCLFSKERKWKGLFERRGSRTELDTMRSSACKKSRQRCAPYVLNPHWTIWRKIKILGPWFTIFDKTGTYRTNIYKNAKVLEKENESLTTGWWTVNKWLTNGRRLDVKWLTFRNFVKSSMPNEPRLFNVWQMFDKCLTSVWQVSDKCLTNGWQMADKCLLNSWWMVVKWVMNGWMWLLTLC